MSAPRRGAYDLAGRLSALLYDGEAAVAQYDYNRASQLTAAVYDNGVSADYTYDATNGRLLKIEHNPPSGGPLMSVSYTYNDDGLRTGCARRLGATTTDISYAYDSLNRLTGETWTEAAATVYAVTFSYDKVGNRQEHQIDRDGDGLVDDWSTYTYAYEVGSGVQSVSAPYLLVARRTNNTTNHVYTWDRNGNLKSETVDHAGTNLERRLYDWDSENRLVRVRVQAADGETWDTTSTVRFVYCPSCGGKRTQKLVWNGEEDASPDAWYRYESEGLNELRVDERYDSQTDGNAVLDANDPWRTLRYTVHGPGKLSHEIKETKHTYFGASSEPLSSTTFYYHFDALGNVLGLSDADGSLLETYRMDAFGVDQNSWTQDTYTTRRITGKEYDRDVGLVHQGARWYDPETGRFIIASRLSRTKEQPFSFCLNSPLWVADPNGRLPIRPGGAPQVDHCDVEAIFGDDAGGGTDVMPPSLPLYDLGCEPCSDGGWYADVSSFLGCGSFGVGAGVSGIFWDDWTRRGISAYCHVGYGATGPGCSLSAGRVGHCPNDRDYCGVFYTVSAPGVSAAIGDTPPYAYTVGVCACSGFAAVRQHYFNETDVFNLCGALGMFTPFEKACLCEAGVMSPEIAYDESY